MIDANSIGYAAMYQPALAKLSFNGKSTAALHGLPVSIFRIMRLFPSATPIVLWDGRCTWRKDLYPDYKSDRGSSPEKAAIRAAYRDQSPILRQLFFSLGFAQISHPDAEADDIAGVIARNMPKDLQIHMVTTDSDWIQAMDHNVHWYNPRTNVTTTLADIRHPSFKEGPFDSPLQYILAKCMAGDTSDSITGVDGIGLMTAAKVLREYGSFEQLWARADAGEKFKGVKLQSLLTPEAREVYARNRSIMQWTEAQIPPDLYVAMPQPQIEDTIHVAKQWGLNKLAEQFSDFSPNQRDWSFLVADIEIAMQYREYDESILGLSRFPGKSIITQEPTKVRMAG